MRTKYIMIRQQPFTDQCKDYLLDNVKHVFLHLILGKKKKILLKLQKKSFI